MQTGSSPGSGFTFSLGGGENTSKTSQAVAVGEGRVVLTCLLLSEGDVGVDQAPGDAAGKQQTNQDRPIGISQSGSDLRSQPGFT